MPARDQQSPRDGAPVTAILVALNVSVQLFLAGLLIESPAHPERVFHLLLEFGLVPERFWSGAVWQPLTSMFLHGVLAGLDLNVDGTLRGAVPSHGSVAATVFSWGSLHVLANMVAVWSLGRAMEQTLGSWRFAGLYFVSGLGGALFTLALDSSGPQSGVPTVGASGGVVGVLGALAVFYPHSRLLVFFIPMQARTAALGLGAVSLFFLLGSDGGFVSHTGHLGGLVLGLVYSRFALQLQVSREQLVRTPSGSRSTLGAIHAPRQPEEARTPPAEGTRVQYDPQSGRFVHKHF